jgi:VanZ family protein
MRTVRVPAPVRWSVVVAVMGFIFYSSVVEPPSGALPPMGPFGVVGLDKWLHVAAYAGLATTVAYALAAHDVAAWLVAVLAFGVALAYGLGIELVQSSLPHRDFSLLDLLANALGSAVVAVWLAGRRWARRVPAGS